MSCTLSKAIITIHYSISLVAQLVKNPLAMPETWVWSLGWEDPWRRERLPTPVFWAGKSHGLYSPWNSPGQMLVKYLPWAGTATGVDSCSLLQGIFPTQGSNPGLLHCRWILYQLSQKLWWPFNYRQFLVIGFLISWNLGFSNFFFSIEFSLCPTLNDEEGISQHFSICYGLNFAYLVWLSYLIIKKI